MLAQRYVIITLLEPLKDGDEFLPENYPLHITIVPSFQLEVMDGTLIKKLTNSVARQILSRLPLEKTSILDPVERCMLRQ